MTTGRAGIICVATTAVLSFALDAAADKGGSHRIPGMPELNPGWARHGFGANPPGKGASPPGMPGSPGPGRSDRGPGGPPDKGLSVDKGPGSQGPRGSHGSDGGMPESAGNSGSNSGPGSSGASPGHKGKDKKDSPDENIQASAAELEGKSAKSKPLHEIPTCQ